MLRHTLAVWRAVADRAYRLSFAASVRRFGFAALLLLAGIVADPATGQPADALGTAWRSPCDLAFSPDGNLLAVSDRTASRSARGP